MKKFSKRALLSVLILCFALSAWQPNENGAGITKFYYYKGQPYSLTLKNDMLFIKLNKELSESQLNSLVSQDGTPALNSAAYVPSDKRYFISLSSPKDESSFYDIMNRLNQSSDVQYTSPVFSPDNGKTLIGVQDEFIVQFKPDLTMPEINSWLDARGYTIARNMDLTGGLSFMVKVPRNVSAIDAANDIYRSGKTNWAEPNLMFTNLLCFDPNDAFYSQQWALKNLNNNIPGGITGTTDCDMDVDSAWNITTGLPQCKIAVSDTGVDTLHEDLVNNMVVGSGYDFFNNDPYAWDDGNHGTACSGIIAAQGNNSIGVSGVAPGCRIIPVKWLSSSGNGDYAGATNATVWSYQKGAWVISNSWGFVGGASSALDQAILDAVTLGRNGKGSIFVVASGNENGAMRFPASTNPNCLVVGGISPCNQRKSTTSCDLENFWGASFGSNLDLVAPCVKIYTTDRTGSPGYSTGNYFSTFNGTSSATPNTAGVCALAFSRDSTMRWDTLRARIDRTCEKRGSYTYNQPGPRNSGLWNNEMGYGLINANALLLSLGPPPPPPSNDVVVGPFLSLPGQFIAGTNYSIKGKITNGGTNAQTSLPVRFSVNGVTQTTNTIPSLPSGAVDSSAFSWTPATLGNYTLKIFSGAATDENRNNDTITTVVNVLPAGTVIAGQTFCRNGLNILIPESGSAPRDSIVVNIANAFNVVDVNVRLDTIVHTYDGDLSIALTHLAGSVTLCGQVGSGGDNFIGTILNDSASTPIGSGVAPFTGSFQPSSPLSGMNGLAVNGSWKLAIDDLASGDSGVLKAWCLVLRYQTLVGGIGTVEIPNYFSLAQNYPNPFNPNTSIKFSVPSAELVTLKVYDVLGKEVAVLVNEMKQPGFHTVDFNASNLASGIYFYRIDAGEFTSVKRMILVK
jgi:subtilisin family serine protease/subtilisin-like proprotein convertase family protein